MSGFLSLNNFRWKQNKLPYVSEGRKDAAQTIYCGPTTSGAESIYTGQAPVYRIETPTLKDSDKTKTFAGDQNCFHVLFNSKFFKIRGIEDQLCQEGEVIDAIGHYTRDEKREAQRQTQVETKKAARTNDEALMLVDNQLTDANKITELNNNFSPTSTKKFATVQEKVISALTAILAKFPNDLDGNAVLAQKLAEPDAQGKLPLHYFFEQKCPLAALAPLLARIKTAQADNLLKSYTNQSATIPQPSLLHVLCQQQYPIAEIEMFLIKLGGWNAPIVKNTLKTPDREGKTPVYYILERSNDADARTFLDKLADDVIQANVELTGPNGKNTLHLAAALDGETTLEKLIEKTTNKAKLQEKIVAQDNKGRNTLYYAAQSPTADKLSLLTAALDTKENIAAGDKKGWNALHYTAKTGDTVALNTLMAKFGNDAPGKEALCKALMQKNSDGWTVLHMACRYGSKAMVDTILSKLDSAQVYNITQKEWRCWRRPQTLLQKNTHNDKPNVSTFENAITQRVGLIKLYHYLKKRYHEPRFPKDYQARMNDFQQLLTNLKTNTVANKTANLNSSFGHKPYLFLPESDSNAYKKALYGSQRYLNLRTIALNNLSTNQASITASVEEFKAYLEATDKGEPVADEVLKQVFNINRSPAPTVE